MIVIRTPLTGVGSMPMLLIEMTVSPNIHMIGIVAASALSDKTLPTLGLQVIIGPRCSIETPTLRSCSVLFSRELLLRAGRFFRQIPLGRAEQRLVVFRLVTVSRSAAYVKFGDSTR